MSISKKVRKILLVIGSIMVGFVLTGVFIGPVLNFFNPPCYCPPGALCQARVCPLSESWPMIAIYFGILSISSILVYKIAYNVIIK